MRRFAVSVFCISVLSALSAFVTFQVVGPPDRSVPCDPESLSEHHVCFSTVESWPADEVLWVDARPREDWEEDGVEGSILINDQEDWLDFEFGFMSKMNDDFHPKIVVYCNQSGCGSSKYVAEMLREKFSEVMGCEVFVLEGGITSIQESK